MLGSSQARLLIALPLVVHPHHGSSTTVRNVSIFSGREMEELFFGKSSHTPPNEVPYLSVLQPEIGL